MYRVAGPPPGLARALDKALESGRPGFVLIDSHSAESWAQGHVPGAVHLAGKEIAGRATVELEPVVPVVTYCTGATGAALKNGRPTSNSRSSAPPASISTRCKPIAVPSPIR